jgi:hypothetical protein
VGVAFFLVKGMRKSDVEDAGNRDADKVSEMGFLSAVWGG